MYLDVHVEIYSLMVFSFYVYSISCNIVAWWRPSWSRNRSPFNKHTHKSVLVVTGDFTDFLVNKVSWAAHCKKNGIIRCSNTCIVQRYHVHLTQQINLFLIWGNKMPTRCNRWFLLQILLLAQHVSGTTMPIIRSSRVLNRWLLPVVFGALVFKLSVWWAAAARKPDT